MQDFGHADLTAAYDMLARRYVELTEMPGNKALCEMKRSVSLAAGTELTPFDNLSCACHHWLCPICTHKRLGKIILQVAEFAGPYLILGTDWMELQERPSNDLYQTVRGAQIIKGGCIGSWLTYYPWNHPGAWEIRTVFALEPKTLLPFNGLRVGDRSLRVQYAVDIQQFIDLLTADYTPFGFLTWQYESAYAAEVYEAHHDLRGLWPGRIGCQAPGTAIKLYAQRRYPFVPLLRSQLATSRKISQ